MKKKKEVSINEYVVTEMDIEESYREIFDTIRHELRHGYQHATVDDPQNFIVSPETTKIWEDNFDDYKTIEEDGFLEYRDQPVEADARSFGRLS